MKINLIVFDLFLLQRIEYVRQNPKPPDPELPKKRKRFRFSFSARLTLAGQEAMVKAYEDTLVASLKDIYSSEKFNSIIPRSTLSTVPKKPLQVIREAQILLEKINQKSMHKHDLFEAYLRWQEKLKNSSSIELDSII